MLIANSCSEQGCWCAKQKRKAEDAASSGRICSVCSSTLVGRTTLALLDGTGENLLMPNDKRRGNVNSHVVNSHSVYGITIFYVSSWSHLYF